MFSQIRQQNLLIVIVYITLIAVAGWVRLTTYDRYLPLLDYSDESNMFLFSMDMRGVDEAPLADDYGAYLTSEWLAGYPPLYLWLGVGVQRYVDMTTNTFVFPGDYIGAMRLLSVLSNVLTVITLIAIGWKVASPFGKLWAVVTGGFAALPYALNPQTVDVGNLAIPDSLIPLACALSLLGCVLAVVDDKPMSLILSLLGAIAAIYLKYSLLFTLWFPFCGVVILIHRRGWRAMIHWLLTLATISLFTAGYLVWGYGALGLENQEAQGFRERGLSNMFNLDRNLTNLWVALDVSTGLWLFVVLLTLGSIAYATTSRRVHWQWLLLLVPYIAGNALLTSSVVYANLERGGYGRIRFMFPAALAFSVIWALCVVQIGIWWQTHHPNRFKFRFAALTAILILVFLVPAWGGNVQLVQKYAAQHTNLLLWQWSDASIPPEGRILVARDSLAHLAWNRPYSGYDGTTAFDWVHDDHPEQGTPAEAVSAGIAYFVITEQDRQEIFTSASFDDFLSQLWHLKTISADEANVVGETTSVYRLLPPQEMTQVRFGEQITLVGYDLDQTTVNIGGSIEFRPYWQANSTPTTNYSMFVHLYPQGQPTNIIAQFDGAPSREPRLPTTWTDSDERLIGVDVLLNVPENAPSGTYTLAIGLYDFQTGIRLAVEEQDRFEIPIDVVDAAQ